VLRGTEKALDHSVMCVSVNVFVSCVSVRYSTSNALKLWEVTSRYLVTRVVHCTQTDVIKLHPI